jgi:hypothetical protein
VTRVPSHNYNNLGICTECGEIKPEHGH